ncbi:MAG: adenylate/guanylate cyclase domain-containing protein [Actinomycetaceae bacterium]|nr:adenylate/guanylate cyclase domain-containing protein [Actinomycetaceae bacterium]
MNTTVNNDNGHSELSITNEVSAVKDSRTDTPDIQENTSQPHATDEAPEAVEAASFLLQAEHSVDATRWTLIGGAPTLNCKELAKAAQCSVSDVFSFWQSMSFTHPDVNQPLFTNVDVKALEQWVTLVDDEEEIAQSTAKSLIRAQSHLMDRLALWQTEALVQDYVERLGLDDTSARLVLLDRMEDYIDILQNQVVYAWRRRMCELLNQMNEEVGDRGLEKDDPDAYPLDRSMGFVDMVSYTRSSAAMGSHELACLVERFESTCRDVIIERGGRVVKTIGDAVLFVSQDLGQAADIACGLVEECSADQQLLPVRASLVHGNVVSRSGDIFGPPVNLAARLADIAPTGTVFVDEATAKDIEKLPLTHLEFSVTEAAQTNLQGVGHVVAYRLSRSQPKDSLVMVNR